MSRKASASDPRLPVGSNFCKCSGCGEYFGGVTTFDLHRRGRENRACVPPSDVTDKEKRPLLHQNDRGYWVRQYNQGMERE